MLTHKIIAGMGLLVCAIQIHAVLISPHVPVQPSLQSILTNGIVKYLFLGSDLERSKYNTDSVFQSLKRSGTN